MKTSDIKDEDFLDAVDLVCRISNTYAWNEILVSILQTGWPETNEKLVRSKARKLIRRGFLEGCGCRERGCVGSYRVVKKIINWETWANALPSQLLQNQKVRFETNDVVYMGEVTPFHKKGYNNLGRKINENLSSTR